jgi:hypothetical protein
MNVIFLIVMERFYKQQKQLKLRSKMDCLFINASYVSELNVIESIVHEN